jgi:hypothetical protein
MTAKADYTDEEWAILCRAPLVAGFAVSFADPGGPIELTKETMAALRAAGAPPGNQELLSPSPRMGWRTPVSITW